MPYLGNIPATQFAELKYQDFTGGTGTSFTLNDPVGTAQELEVFVNNVRQEPGVAYTVSGTTLTMTGSIVATDDFYVVFQGKSTGTATHPAGQALTATDGTFTNGLTVDDDGTAPLTIDRATSDGDIITIQQDGSTVGTLGATGNDVYLASPSGSDAGIRLGNNIIRPCTTTGGSRDNAIDLGKSDTRFKDLYLGGGAYIGGTGAANYLDDVEEGTFTATLNGGSGHPSTRLTTTGYYTKVNQMVHISFNFNNVTTTSYSGQISIFGLPFTCGEPGRQVFTVGSYFMASFSSSTGSVFGHISVGNTEIYLLGIVSGGGWEDIAHSAGSSRYLQVSGVYRSS